MPPVRPDAVTDGQWCLYSTNCSDEWSLVAAFPSLAAAIHELRTTDRATAFGVMGLEAADPELTDEEAASLFVFSAPNRRYAIRWEL